MLNYTQVNVLSIFFRGCKMNKLVININYNSKENNFIYNYSCKYIFSVKFSIIKKKVKQLTLYSLL